jgi:exonuclease SbcC
VRVLELSLRNYRVFEEVDLELPARVIGIFGENGSGKSSLLESIGFALYGVDAARTKKQMIRTHGVLTDCEVRLVFEHAGEPFEVRRSLKGKGHLPEAELYGGGLLLASGSTDVDAEVRRLLHMDLHVFRASVYAEQKQLDAFSEVAPAKRKEMALRLLGIKPVDDARTAARREAKATKDGAVQLAGAIGDLAALEAELKDAKEAAAEAKRVAAAAAADLRSATADAAKAKRAFADVDAVRERVEKLTVRLTGKTEQRDAAEAQRDGLADRVDRLQAAIAELPALERRLTDLGDVEERLRAATRLVDASTRLGAAQAELDALPPVDVEAADEELRAAEDAQGTARTAAARAEAELGHRRSAVEDVRERLERAAEADPAQPCPTCGRPLGDDFAGYLKHCRAAVAEATSALRAAEKAARERAREAATAEKAHVAAAAAARDVREADATRSRLAEHVAALRGEVVALAEPFGDEAPDVEELTARSDEARGLANRLAELGADRRHLEAARADLAAAEERLAALERELADLAAEAEGLAFDPEEHERLRRARDDRDAALEASRAAERAASDARRDADALAAELGAALRQAKETAARVDELRSEARYVERVAMLLDGFRDHLVARVGPELSREAESLFRDLTNHEYDDLRVDEETLTIQIADGDAYFPIGRFSGSEADLANLALRVAISTHLSRMSGADVGMMVLDEVLASLDEERKDLMVQALARLSSRFHQLFVITHAERVKDQFPASIQVEKVGRRRSTAALV